MAKWFFEPGHTAAEFCARHMMVSCVRGHFKNVHGTLDFDPDNPQATSVDVTIDAKGLWSGEPDRDTHLKSADFLDVDKHPTITFKSTKIEPAGTDRYTLTGDLTIKGVTKPVTLNVVKYGEFNDPNMGHRIGYAAEGQINRKDFGMSFDAMLDGKFIVSNEIKINIEGELVEVPVAETANVSSS